MKVIDMFPDRVLGGKRIEKPIKVRIMGIRKISMSSGRGRPEEEKWVVEFCNVLSSGALSPVPHVMLLNKDIRSQGFVLRKTLAIQINEALGVDDTDDWLQKHIVLFPVEEKVGNRKVIALCARAPAPAPPAVTSNTHTSTTPAATTAPAGTVPTATGK